MGQDTLFYRKSTLRIHDKILSADPPLIMGILNVTPDSFSDGGLFTGLENAMRQVKRMIGEGADIIDVGGYSTRPGAAMVTEQEEIDRTAPVIAAITEQYPEITVSVDTFRAKVAAEAVAAGAGLVNDVSGGQQDPDMYSTVAGLNVPYVLMHMRGTPQTMQTETEYDNILLSIWQFFRDKIHLARQAGVREIILDPGFGFAKTISQNYYILENLGYFHSLNLPLLVGLSRKSMIYKRLNIPAAEAVNGTTVLNVIALQQGAQILRVHDVREAKETIALMGNFKKNSS